REPKLNRLKRPVKRALSNARLGRHGEFRVCEARTAQAGARIGTSERPVRHATAKSRIAPPERIPRAPTETATTSAWEAPTPEVIRAAPLAPTCVAAPAGPIGNAAAAAPAQRKSSVSGNEKPTPSVPKSRKRATARTSQHADTNVHAWNAALREVVRGPSQRPSRKRRAR